MNTEAKPSLWNEIKAKVQDDLPKAGVENVKNYAAIVGLAIAGIKTLLLASWWAKPLCLMFFVPALFILRWAWLYTVVITTLALIGKENYAARGFGNSAWTKDFWDGARWQFSLAIATAFLSPVALILLILSSWK